jgi:GNAT superfamily N-acetyltransferase
MDVQRLRTEEAARLREIRLRALADAPDAFGSTLAGALVRSDEMWVEEARKLTTFIAVADDRDVGMVRGVQDAHDERSAWLLSMWVEPDARGSGAADALVDRLVEWARSQRYRQLMLDVADANARAIGFYERKGFLPTGEVGHLPPPRQHITEHRRVLRLEV